jgi:hypothetical protein
MNYELIITPIYDIGALTDFKGGQCQSCEGGG